MANKDELTELEARIDAMMDPSDQKATVTPSKASDTPVGAPPLPSKKITVADATAETIPAVEPLMSVTDMPAEAVGEKTADDIAIESLQIDTPETDEAIADIVAAESDEVLAAEDAGIKAEQEVAEPLETTEHPHGHPIFWFIIIFLAVIAILAGYVLLNPGLELPLLG